MKVSEIGVVAPGRADAAASAIESTDTTVPARAINLPPQSVRSLRNLIRSNMGPQVPG